MSLKDQTISGMKWTAGARIVNQVLHFTISILLARLLIPEDFGLLGMILVFTGFANLFSEMGFGAALIQRKEITENHLSSVFWLNLIIGLIIGCIVSAVSPFLSNFYNEPRLKTLTMLIAVNFVISPLKTVHFSNLNRAMDFHKIAIIETTTMMISGCLAVTLALIGLGVWTLVWQMIASTTIGVIITWRVTEWKPRLHFDRKATKELLGFSGNLLGFNVINYWVRNIDNLLIGKYIGSSGLGIYSRAYVLMLMPIRQISITFGRVMFSSLSKCQDDKGLVKKIYLKTICAIALLSFPMMMGLLSITDSFVLALLGAKWTSVIPVLRVFTLLGLVQSIGTTVGWIYKSQGRTDLQLKWGLISGILLVLSVVIGVINGSIMSVAICYAFMSGVILLYPNFAIPGKLINMTFGEVIRAVSGAFVCSCLMSACVYLLGFALPLDWSPLAKLVTQVTFGVTFYLVILHTFKLSIYLALKQLVKEQWSAYFTKNDLAVQ